MRDGDHHNERRQPPLVVVPRGRLLLVLEIAIVNGRIAEITAISDPARLRKLDLAVLDDERRRR